MKITIDKKLSSKNKQPKIIDLGTVSTTVNDLLNNSSIVVSGDSAVILKYTIGSKAVYSLFSINDYNEDLIIGLNLNINESDLIKLNSNISIDGGDGYITLTNDSGEFTITFPEWTSWTSLTVQNCTGSLTFRKKGDLIQLKGSNIKFSSSTTGLVSICSKTQNISSEIFPNAQGNNVTASCLIGSAGTTPYSQGLAILTSSDLQIINTVGDSNPTLAKPYNFNILYAI